MISLSKNEYGHLLHRDIGTKNPRCTQRLHGRGPVPFYPSPSRGVRFIYLFRDIGRGRGLPGALSLRAALPPETTRKPFYMLHVLQMPGSGRGIGRRQWRRRWQRRGGGVPLPSKSGTWEHLECSRYRRRPPAEAPRRPRPLPERARRASARGGPADAPRRRPCASPPRPATADGHRCCPPERDSQLHKSTAKPALPTKVESLVTYLNTHTR